MSKAKQPDHAVLAEVAAAIQQLWDRGCPMASLPEESARLAIRRWNSARRRHRKITREVLIQDVANGLIEHYEGDRTYLGPGKVHYIEVAEAVASVLSPLPNAAPSGDIPAH